MRAPEENNMVLDIDEYWPLSQQSNHTNFTIFKKFAQRIQKRVGNDNYKWLNQIKSLYAKKKNIRTGNKDLYKDHPDGISYVYVFGHSLDVTDKDILSELLGDEVIAVTIYCQDKETEGELIANSIKLIGEQRLIEKVNNVPSKFNFEVLG